MKFFKYYILIALAAIFSFKSPETEQFVPKHEGTAVPVTVYEYDGYDGYSYDEYRYNYHSNKYYKSNSGNINGLYEYDYTNDGNVSGYSVSDPWNGQMDGYVSARWK